MLNPLEIEILTKYLGADQAQKAAQDLENLRKGAAGAGDSAQQFGVHMDTMGEGLHKAEQRMEGMSGQGREMYRVFSMMDRIAPGTGILLESMFVGPLGGVMAVLVGLELLGSAIKKIDEENAESDRIGKDLAGTDKERAEAVDKVRDALVEADVAQAEFLHNLVRNTEDAIDKSYQLAQAILKSKGTALGEEDGARKGIAEKEIEDMERRGVLSHAAALKAKEDQDIAYEQRKLMRMMAQDALEMDAAQRQLFTKKIEGGKGGKLDVAEKDAAAKYAAADKAKTENDERMAQGQAQIARGTKAREDLEETGVTDESVQKITEAFASMTSSSVGKALFKKLEGEDVSDRTRLATMSDFMTKISEPDFIGSGVFALLPKMLQDAIGDHTGTVGAGFAALKQMGAGSAAFENLAKYQNAQIDIQSGAAAVAQARKNQVTVDINEGNAKSDLDAARKELEKNREDVRTLQDKISEMKATNAVKEGGAKEDLGLDKSNAALMRDRATAENFGGASAIDKQKLIADASKIAGHAVDLQTAAAMIEAGANNIDAFMNQVSLLAKSLSKFTPADFQRQLDELRREVAQATSNANLH